MASFETARLNELISERTTKLFLDDQPVAMIIKHIGTAAAATIEVTAAGDLLFKEDAAPDVSIKLPVGGTGGTIDVSDAEADNLGKIVDHINADPNWDAVLVDSLRADATDNKLLLLAAIDAKLAAGRNINSDTSEALFITASIQNSGLPSLEEAEQGFLNRAFRIRSKNTFASGTNTIQVHKAVGDTETQIWTQAGGATTVENEIDFVDTVGIDGTLGGRLVVRIIGSAFMTGFLEVLGKSFSIEPKVGADLGFS